MKGWHGQLMKQVVLDLVDLLYFDILQIKYLLYNYFIQL